MSSNKTNEYAALEVSMRFVASQASASHFYGLYHHKRLMICDRDEIEYSGGLLRISWCDVHIALRTSTV